MPKKSIYRQARRALRCVVMVEVSILRCGNCGGTLPEHARSCPYCKSVVAARRCIECFHMNLPAAVHCAACGQELGLEPVPEAEEMTCPSCSSPFLGIPTEAEGRVHECSSCGGQWTDHTTLRALFERRIRLSLGLDPRGPVSFDATSTRVRYLPCPVCAGLMNRKNFGERSGVIVDVCRHHGVWFDPGELPRVLAFVARGGLEEAARRQAEREREERHSSEVMARASIMPTEMPAAGPSELIAKLLARALALLTELNKPAR